MRSSTRAASWLAVAVPLSPVDVDDGIGSSENANAACFPGTMSHPAPIARQSSRYLSGASRWQCHSHASARGGAVFTMRAEPTPLTAGVAPACLRSHLTYMVAAALSTGPSSYLCVGGMSIERNMPPERVALSLNAQVSSVAVERGELPTEVKRCRALKWQEIASSKRCTNNSFCSTGPWGSRTDLVRLSAQLAGRPNAPAVRPRLGAAQTSCGRY